MRRHVFNKIILNMTWQTTTRKSLSNKAYSGESTLLSLIAISLSNDKMYTSQLNAAQWVKYKLHRLKTGLGEGYE